MILEIIPYCSSSNIRKPEVEEVQLGAMIQQSRETQVQLYKDGGGLEWILVSPAKVPYFSLDLKI